jgi:hypothetical protein
MIPDEMRPDFTIFPSELHKPTGHRRYDEPLDKNVGFSANPPHLKITAGTPREGITYPNGFNGMDRFHQAIHFATWVHEGQVRKYTGLPYVTHPIRCGNRAINLFQDADLGIAMLLHDGPEDQIERCPPSLIEVLYGKRVRSLVDSLTNPSKLHPELNREEKKKMDRAHYAKAYIYTKMLKMIDRIDNLKELDIKNDAAFAALYCTESSLLLQALEETTQYASSSPFGVLAIEMRDTISALRMQMGIPI